MIKPKDIVHNPDTSETKKVFIKLGETFVATDGSINTVSEWIIKTDGDSDDVES